MGCRIGVHRILVGKPEGARERNNFKGPGVDGSIILRWIFGKCDVGAWTGSMWLRWTGDGHL